MQILSTFGQPRTRPRIKPSAVALALALSVAISAGPLHAQTTLLVNRVEPREAVPDTAATLVEKVSRAHQQAITNAQALATYVERNSSELNNSTMRAHCDAIGRSLDDALDAIPRLASMLTTSTAKDRARLILKHDAHAKQTYRTLLGMLRGSSITAPEIRMLAIQIHQDVSAAEQELARIPIAQPATTVARSR